MLEGIDTGYEARFDFPRRETPPDRPYLFASVPRTGSTYVSHLLWQSGCLGAPLEYLNFEPAGPNGHADGDPAGQEQIWRSALAHRTSPNGVFGLKAFPMQMEVLQQQNPPLVVQVMRFMLPGNGQGRVVQLRRRDRTAHAISYARAILSGVWRAEQEHGGRPEPEYSSVAMEKSLKLIDEQEGAWEHMYAGLGLTPLVIWYEDVLADPLCAVGQVAGYLEVELDPAAAVEVPPIKRQSQQGSQAWKTSHATG